jgi:hypothetical protein
MTASVWAEASKTRAVGGGASGGTLVDVLLANVIRENTPRGVPKT